MKFRPTLADGASGSLGGMTASHNRGGYYFRTRGVPTNPNTIRQQAVRSAFGTLVAAWLNTLTDPERTAWTTYGENTPVTNVLGDPIQLTGQQQFIRSNTPRLQAGLALVTAAPTTFNTGEPITSVSSNGVAGPPNTIGVDLAGTMETNLNLSSNTPDDGDVLVYLSTALNASTNFFKGPYQLASAVAIAAGVAFVDWGVQLNTLTNDNGGFVDGQFRGLRARIAYDDGRLSQPYQAVLPVLDDV